eukprot:symbB.v1.2.021768.t1/scaffold1821.1/size219240/7
MSYHQQNRCDPCGSLVYTGAAAIIASGSRARSPNWHRRQRRRRSVARRYIHLSRANGQVRVTPKLCRAIWILCDHHAQPRYKELYKMYRRKNQDQEWPAWSPGQWPKKQKSGKGGGKDGGKKAVESAPVVRAYDSDGSSTMSSRSSAAGSTQLDAGDEIQWDAWLKEIKESIHTQKKKHEEAQERMELELHNLRKEEEDLKNGVEDNEEQMEEEEDLEQQLEQLMDGKQSKKQMDQKALQAMKKEMEAEYQIRMAKEREMMQHEFQKMLHHTLALHATTSGTPTPTVVDLESADTKMEGQQDVPTSGQTMTSAAAKAALVPFGVARRAKGTTVTSPYGRRKDQEDLPTEQKDAEEQRMEEILKNQPTKEELKEASTEELETGANLDTGQR